MVVNDQSSCRLAFQALTAFFYLPADAQIECGGAPQDPGGEVPD